MPKYSLKTILSTFTDKNGKKLIILNAAPVGGMSSGLIKIFFYLLPLLEYSAIFNPFIFHKLGLATAIVTYIVFLSIVMIIIFLLTLRAKKKTIEKINSSWKYYFNDIDVKMVLSSGITPYSKFFDYYSMMANENLSDEQLYEKLKIAFKEMQEENKELLIAIKKDNKNI